MTRSLTASGRLTAVTAVVAALAAIDWTLRPDRTWPWALGLLSMMAICVVVASLAPTRRSDTARRAVVDAGSLAGLLLATGLAVALLRIVGLGDDSVAARGSGVATSFVLLVIGNAIPKHVPAPKAGSCARGTYAGRRFAGWMFAGAGALGLAAWLFAPLAQAPVIATVACFGATALVVIRCIATPGTGTVDRD